ncbi:hypothetical protein LIER_11518 [Lithospermum erythrorhizon]|uniref:Uncharacterized protein n=1 Tax=Lithospermum erythrorhizon TaxID=34254 RepID=A0AAV3PQL5_LITER
MRKTAHCFLTLFVPEACCTGMKLVSCTLLKYSVFGSYGLFLPFIILSILLASGLKAFLLALALPLAQSTIWFLLQLIWGGTNYKSRRKTNSKRKSRVRGSSGFATKRDRKEKRSYPSWEPGKDVSGDNWGNDGASNFGGWDELDLGNYFTRGSPKSDQRAGRSQGRPSKKDNFTRLERTSDTPLLLRLLIAVFPFLSWWIKLF